MIIHEDEESGGLYDSRSLRELPVYVPCSLPLLPFSLLVKQYRTGVISCGTMMYMLGMADGEGGGGRKNLSTFWGQVLWGSYISYAVYVCSKSGECLYTHKVMVLATFVTCLFVQSKFTIYSQRKKCRTNYQKYVINVHCHKCEKQVLILTKVSEEKCTLSHKDKKG